MIVRNEAIIPLTPAADQTGKEGYAIELSSGEASILNNAADVPFGLITEGAPTDGKSSIALPNFGGTVRVKLDGTPGTVNPGTDLAITATGTFKADAGSGARVLFAQAVESGAGDELIEAVLFKPVKYSS